MTVNIAWAVNSEGSYCYIKQVPNGKACNCRCIECNEQLIAYNSKTSSKTEYFGHEQDSVCQGESVLHKVAKSILLDFASENQSILLPGYYASSSGLDCMGNEVSSTYHELEPRIKICKADSEVRFGNIIIDSVLADAYGRQVGIEIYVTNAKSNEDKKKFAQLDFEVVEIDISKVAWHVEPEELRSLLIRKAKRSWVNEAFVKARCYEVSKQKLPKLIEQRNAKIYGTFKFEIDNLLRNSSRSELPLKPMKSNKFTLLDGKDFTVSKNVAVSRIRNVLFNETEDHATAEADIIVDGNYAKRQVVPVIFSINGVKPKSKIPKLFYQLTFNEEVEVLEFKTSLCGINKWQDALKEIAEYEVSVANSKIQDARAEKQGFLDNLSTRPSDINSLLCERYSVHLKPSDSNEDGWNMPARLWALFLCEFILPNYQGRVCSTAEAASHQIIEECLNLNSSRVARAKRAQRIRELLLYLYKVELVRALDDNKFFIPTDLEAFPKISELLNSVYKSSCLEPIHLSFYGS